MLKTSSEELNRMLEKKIELINKALEDNLPQTNSQILIIEEACSYSLLAGGKRIRPLLLMLTAELFDVKDEETLSAACSVEFIHAYSLIHDDLPAMDDDDLRRGKPTSHKVFGEAIAVLAGDSLLTHSFGLLTGYVEISCKLVDLLVEGAGVNGMLGGQVADMLAESETPTQERLLFIHRHKTAALIRASVLIGGTIGKATDEIMKLLDEFGTNLGLAFQVIDDILDVVGDEKKLGKKVGKDKDKNKCTYPSVFGLEESKEYASEFTNKALESLDKVRLELQKSEETQSKVKFEQAFNNLKQLTIFLLKRIN